MDPVTLALAQGFARDAQQKAVINGVLLDDFSSISTWGKARGTITSVTDDEFGYAMEVKNAADQSNVAVERDAFISMKNRYLSFAIKPDENYDGGKLEIRVGSHLNTHRFDRFLPGSTEVVPGRWHRITVPLADAIPVGAQATPAGAADVRVLNWRIDAKTDTVTTFLIADLRVHDLALPPTVIWCFDDGWRSTYEHAFPILSAHGFIGSIAVETGNVGDADRCALAELGEMYAAGWDMLNHTVEGTPITAGTLSDAKTAINDAYDWLRTNGFQRGSQHFVYPGGNWDATVLPEVAVRCQTARMAGGRRITTPYLADYALLRPYYLHAGATLEAAKSDMDSLADYGGVMYLTLHDLVTSSPTSEEWTISDFTALVEYAATLGLASSTPSRVWPRRPEQ